MAELRTLTSGTRQPSGVSIFAVAENTLSNMETLYSLPFAVLECPNVKLKKPSWLHMPSAMTVYAIVIVSYFLITGGKLR